MRNIPWTNLAAVTGVIIAITLITVKNLDANGSYQLLNVSYDPTRELYRSLNEQFAANYEQTTGRRLRIKQSHGGSSRQARSVIDGQQPADVVTLGLFSDVDALRKRGLIAEDWSKRLPHNSQPYTSTIVFLVRKGNPKRIHDWPDLIRPNVSVITPDPRTSGNGKLSALAAWGAALRRGASEAEAGAYLKQFYEHIPVLDIGARSAATTFAVEKIGDVHLTWENEAIREVAESKGQLEIVYPPVSILAEPFVAWVDSNVDRNKSESAAKAYLEFLFTDEAQETMAKLGYRPVNAEILKKYPNLLPHLDLFPITLIAKDWDDAQQKFFAANGVIDVVYKPAPQRTASE
ncbi:MAG TPA: sulfate ABC transporter substrate-binding protein [Methylocella sp.]|nr:sulfate ABC transporter substrate-binding protein [Methylocella sp.]